mmetsp:Transcript_15362/g.31884  ORF Transcript_15362/g.31884 Transcript_15362/m.31884 type:complete len:287 (+) Transcript_15362:132-992(+)
MIPDAYAFGFLFMLTEWAKRPVRGEWLRLMMAHSDTLRLPEPIAGGFQLCETPATRVNPGFRAYIDKKYHKIVSVVDFLAASGAQGAEAVVAACEIFAQGSARQWLKVAGAEKADLVDWRLQARPAPDRGVVAEFGSFVGYSCVRMAWRSWGETRVLSLESDAVHVLVARHVAIVAGRSPVVELVPGMAHDSVRRIIDEWGCESCVFAFMDHRGTRFHVELQHLERLRAFAPDAKFLADNTLKPGAPVNLWHFDHCGPRHLATSWSLPEFASTDCEDWMTASEIRP